MGHRGGFDLGPPPAGAADAVAPPSAPIDPKLFRGFSYFLGDPGDAARTSIGADPAKARAILQALYNLLPIGPNVDNPGIPSGYTYLLQFVAHDLVDTTVPFWAAADAGVPSRNMRDAALGLDTLYGGGPTVCPMAFKPAGSMADYRTELRLGLIGDAAALGMTTGACPMRDIPRLKLDAAPPPSNVGDASQVYLADSRNDDNTLVSQIVVLFSIVHNAIAAKLSGLGSQTCFALTNVAVLRMYHRIIREDLLKRLLHPQVYGTLLNRPAGDPSWLWHGGDVPLEFTHGAFRVGHAMVRPFYRFNDNSTFAVTEMLGGPIVGDPVREPLPSTWIVEWSKFFDLGGDPNLSLKLAVHQQLPLDFDGMFTPIAASTPGHMTLRDWLSAANARMWRFDSLIEAAGPKYPALTFMSGAAVGQWLADLVQASLGTAADKAVVTQHIPLLRSDLPLPLYVLLESQTDPAIAGAHMGPLGSIIVGETIFRRIAIETEALAGLVPAAHQALGADWDSIERVASMPDLVRLAADWGGLSSCPQLPFLNASIS